MPGFLTDESLDRSTSADPVPGQPVATMPIMFLHIPRTGGFTLKTMLESIFGTRRSLLDAHFYDPSEEDLAGLAVIEGHVRTRYFARRFGPEWYLNGMTMVREPITRAVSQVRHARTRLDDKRHDLVASEIRDPHELFGRVPLWFNLETKLLASRPHDADTLDDTALDDAKSMLDRLAFGLTEEFAISTALFAERFALEVPRFGKTNASSPSGDEDLLSEEFRAAARAQNLIDEQLYEYARVLFARRVGDYTDALLGSPFDEGTLESELDANGTGPVGDVVRVQKDVAQVDLRGWVVVDGHPADAVLVQAGQETTPLCCRIFSPEAGQPTRDAGRRFAGVVGAVSIPPDVDTVELIAMDRTRKRRAQRAVDVIREDDRDQIEPTRRRRFRSRARQALRARRGSERSEST